MRFYNSGKYKHRIGVSKDTGKMMEEDQELVIEGCNPGAAIVNFPGHQFHRVVEAGAWVELPEDISTESIKRACPSLLTEAEAISRGLIKGPDAPLESKKTK